MVQFVFGNFFQTELVVGVQPSDTVMQVPPSMSLLLPAIASGSQLQAQLTLWDGNLSPEIVGCILNPQTGVLTVLRAQEGTTAQAWGAGAQIRSSLTALVINQALAAYFNVQVLLAQIYLPLSGGTLTGKLVLAANQNPTGANDAVTKAYADTVGAGGLPVVGGTMQGSINMNNNRILLLPAPVSPQEPATKAYADNVNSSILAILADRSGKLTSAGNGTQYTVTTNATYATLIDGFTVVLKFNLPNAAAPTLQVTDASANVFSAVKMRAQSGVELLGGEFAAGSVVELTYVAATNEYLINSQPEALTLSGFLTVAGRLTMQATDFFVPTIGTTAQRPATPVTGQTRFNSTLRSLESFSGTTWIQSKQLISPPGGMLSLINAADPIMSSDQIGIGNVWYTPRYDNVVPIFDGSDFISTIFSQLQMVLSASHVAGAIYDFFLAYNGLVLSIGSGPAWQNAGGGTGNRGTGANTTQISLFGGIWTNSNPISLLNGATTWSVPVNQATYLGSGWVDATPGQITTHFSLGKARRRGLYNAYNQVPVCMIESDNTNNVAGGASFQPFNNDNTNNISTLLGLPDGNIDLDFNAVGFNNGTSDTRIAVGANNTTTPASVFQTFLQTNSSTVQVTTTISITYTQLPLLGMNQFYPLTKGGPFNGIGLGGITGNNQMLFRARYKA